MWISVSFLNLSLFVLLVYNMVVQKNTSGFTIVELLIVIVVIAILAAIAIVSYNSISLRAKDAATQSTTTQLEKQSRLNQTSELDGYILNTSDNPPETREDFVSQYNYGSFSEELCIIGYDTDCDASLVNGVIPSYDKERVFISANAGRGWPAIFANLSIARWSYAQQAWISTRISTFYCEPHQNCSAPGFHEETTTQTNTCAPFLDDSAFTASCQYMSPQ